MLFLRFYHQSHHRGGRNGPKHTCKEMYNLRKHTGLCLMGVVCALVLGSCKPKVSPSLIESMTEYVDGVAIATLKQGNYNYYYFVDEDLVKVDPGLKLTRLDDFVDGYAYAESEKQEGNCTIRRKHIYNRKGEVVESGDFDGELMLVPGGKLWRSGGNGMQLVSLADNKVLFDEKMLGLSVTPSGTSRLVRKRSDKAADIHGNVPLLEYMVLDSNGGIVVPWGRIAYIGDFSNGMAVASNSERPGYRWHVDEVTHYTAPGYDYSLYGFIDENGSWVLPEKYYKAEGYNDAGYGRVSTAVPHYGVRPKWRYVDRNGRVLSGDEAEKARRSF